MFPSLTKNKAKLPDKGHLIVPTNNADLQWISESTRIKHLKSKPSQDIELQDINEPSFDSPISELQLQEDNDKGVDDFSAGAYEGSFSDVFQTHEFIFPSKHIKEHTSSCIAIDDVKHKQLAPLSFLDGLKMVESEPKQLVKSYEEQPLNDGQKINKGSLHDFYDLFGELLQSSK